MALRLKSLELNGYKTFANRTNFEFSETITAIVGPNGSGKSNIADAMRWVLGEQSYSLLRGRKTDDMIFSGSDARPQAGMASATLVFDNTDGWLPIDFSEVSVTRRAYRDGQNEYLINNQRVRLKDISELLSQSGLAERTYTVIGQGLVDAALSLNPSERRRLFEEAAGIGIYRSRKEQALRRLEKTMRNLERVQDILAELKPRLRSLQRQAAKAEEYNHVKKDLKEILREWYGYHWHKAQLELKDSRDLSARQQAGYRNAQQKEAEISTALQANREAINQLREKLAGWHKDLAEKHSNREVLNRDLAVGDERERSLERQKENLQRELMLAQEEVLLKRARADEARERVTGAQELLDEATEMARNAERAYDERRAERESIEQKLRDSRLKLEELASRKIEFQARRLSLQDSIAKIDRENGEIETILTTIRTEWETAREETSRLAAAAAESLHQVNETEKALEDARKEHQSLEQAIAKARKELSVQETSHSRLRAELEVLEKAEASLTGYSQGAKLLVEAARSKRLSGSQDVLSSLLHVPAELEVAVAAALGEFVDSFLLEGGVDADQALDLLLREGARASLLPVKGLRSEKTLLAPDDPDCLGVASTLVQIPDELRSVLDAVLGQVLVVRSRAAARRLLKTSAPHVKAVTLEGELFFPSGAVFVDSKGGSGTIARPRQRREIIEQLETAERELKKQIDEMRTMDERQQSMKEAIGAKEVELKSRRDAWQQALEEQRAASLKQEQLARRADFQEERLQALAAENRLAAASMEELESGGVDVRRDISELEEQIRQEGHALAGIPMDEVQEQLAHWKTQLLLAETAMQESSERREELDAELEKSRTQVEHLNERLADFESQATQISQNMVQSREVEDGLADEIKSIQALILPAEEQMHTLEVEQSSLLDQEAAARQALNVAERHSSQSQIAFARQQESLEALRQRIEDDFGLVDFEYQDQVSGPTPLPFGELVEHLPLVKELTTDIEESLKQKRSQLRRIGSIYPEAKLEYDKVEERFEFLSSQLQDLTAAEKDVRQVIAELDGLMDREFRKTFDTVASEFKLNFSRLFGGGSARLMLSDGEDFNETGVDIEARLPGKRSQRLALLSGGERSLTAAALVFSLLKASPTPFCVMDEVDAMLDEANIGRFREILAEFSLTTQFVVITHNRNTVQAAETIYGVTMGRDTASQIISLKLDDVDERYAPQGS